MAFVQIIEFQTSKSEEMMKATEEFEAATAGRHKVRRDVWCQDRERPGHYVNIVFFDSYEEAMENSAMPEIDALAQKMMALCDGEPHFYNLDVEFDNNY